MNSCIIQFHLSTEVLGYSYSSKTVKNLLIDYKLQENVENKRIVLIIQQGNQQGILFFKSLSVVANKWGFFWPKLSPVTGEINSPQLWSLSSSKRQVRLQRLSSGSKGHKRTSTEAAQRPKKGRCPLIQ